MIEMDSSIPFRSSSFTHDSQKTTVDEEKATQTTLIVKVDYETRTNFQSRCSWSCWRFRSCLLNRLLAKGWWILGLLSINLLLLFTRALNSGAIGGVNGSRETWWTIESATIPSIGTEGWCKGRRGIPPSCGPRFRSLVITLRSMTTKPSKTLTCPVLIVRRKAEASEALGSKVAIVHALVMAQVWITPANQRRALKTHGKVATCSRPAVLNLHGKVLLATLRQKSRQLIVEPLRFADASLFIGFPILVEIARSPTLGAQFLCSSWTETHPSCAFFLICSFGTSSPPAYPTLELHVLDYPVVRVTLDVNALSEIVDNLPLKFSHFHHTAILGSLRSIWSFRLFVRVDTTVDVQSTSKTREVWVHDRIPLAKIYAKLRMKCLHTSRYKKNWH